MNVTPLDLRQHPFRSVVRGFDRTEVMSFLSEAADDYEQALRELDKLREELVRKDEQLTEHREREANLRNTLLTAQKLADDVRNSAKQNATIIVREAQNRADTVLQQAQVRLDDVKRDITELRLRRTDVESSLKASIGALNHALEFIRSQDARSAEDTLRVHRPRPVPVQTTEPALTAVKA